MIKCPKCKHKIKQLYIGLIDELTGQCYDHCKQCLSRIVYKYQISDIELVRNNG